MNTTAMLITASKMSAWRKPQMVRAHVVPHAHRNRYNRSLNLLGPSLMALDSLFDLSPSRLLETEDFMGLERARAMAVDFVEHREGFQIKADIPGVAKKDIKLDVDHNVLTISAKRSSETSNKPQIFSTASGTDAEVVDDSNTVDVVHDSSEDKIPQQDANVLRYERFDSFQSRSFRVPKTADLSTISAKYENGVLTVDMKKRQDVIEERRTVDIA